MAAPWRGGRGALRTPQNGAVTTPADRTVPRHRWLLAAVVIVLAAVPVVLRYLVFWPLDQWQVDVEVYREAGVSLLTGRPVYAALTEAPQLLPFTYPPFAAVLALPLAMMPFGAAGWLWTGLQVLATTAIVWYAGYRLIHRAGAWMPLALALLTAPMLWLHPVSDGIRFGQVNAFMVLACLMDLREPRPGLVRRVPRGVLVGLAMAVKLTPGVFVVHFLVTKRWKEAATAVGTAVAVTLGVWVLLPQASFAFWGGALQDPARLGPNMGTSNQSIRGFLLRVGPEGMPGTLLWLVCVAARRGVRVLAGPPALPAGRLDRRGRRGRADGLPAVTGGVDPPLPLGRRGDLRPARRRPAARPPPAVGRARGHRVLPVPAAVVGHLLAQPPRLARAARAGAAERRRLRRARGPRAALVGHPAAPDDAVEDADPGTDAQSTPAISTAV